MSDILQHYGVLGMKWGVRKSKSSVRREIKRLSKRSKSKTGKYHVESGKDLANFFLRPVKTQSAMYKLANKTVDNLRAKSIRSKVSRKKDRLTKEQIKKKLAKARRLEKRAKSENAGIFVEMTNNVANGYLRPIKSGKGIRQLVNKSTYKLKAERLRDKAKTTQDRQKTERMLEKAKRFDKLAKTAKNDNALKAYGKHVANVVKRPITTATATNKLVNDEVDRIRVQKLRKKLRKMKSI